MWRPGWTRPAGLQKAESQAAPGLSRDRLAGLLALVTVACLGAAFILYKDTRFLMPGPLASAHGTIKNCNACHTKSGSGKLTWVQGLTAGDPHADSKACLTCHKMPETAFNAHSASEEVLTQSTQRLTEIAAKTPAPPSARAQSIAFPTHDVGASGFVCATCHQEHQGINFNLNKISNEQCRSCHVVKFDSFDGDHPKFDNYPFKRRTQIIYDHAGHFGKHFPEVAKKEPDKRIPSNCSTCHDSSKDKRVMAVVPFDQTCSTCHLNQITGKERVSGPKGIAFLTLPGLDLQTLKKKNASIGEWPDAAEAEFSPFMKVMISRNERGRSVIKNVDSLNLQDLTAASDDQIKAVTDLVWEIKRLYFALITEKASDVLADLTISGEAKLSATLVADLTASIPRDVVISAQEQWLPNLATEIAKHPETSDQKQGGWSPVITDATPAAPAASEPSRPEEPQAAPSQSPQAVSSDEGAAGKTDIPIAKPQVDRAGALQPPMRAGIKFAENTAEPEAAAEETTDAPAAEPDGGNEAHSAQDSSEGPIIRRVPLPSGTSREIEARSKNGGKEAGSDGADGKSGTAKAKPDGGDETPSAGEQPDATKAGSKDDGNAAQPDGAAGKTDTANKQPQATAAEQTDDLLNLTDDEKAGITNTDKAAQAAGGNTNAANAGADGAASASADAASKADENAPAGAAAKSGAAVAGSQTRATPVVSIESGVDPESWADYGGWYRQDYAIFYRPIGHKDKFIYSWLFLTGPQAPKGDPNPAAAVFDYLTSKDAQGSCTKCHSVDEIQGNRRVVNFSPPTVESKKGRFTNFIHEPHFGIMDNRGCLNCHKLKKVQSAETAEKTDAASSTSDAAVSADTAVNAATAAPAGAPADSGAPPPADPGAPSEPGTAAANSDAEKAGSPYLKSYEQGNPQNFAANFGEVNKNLCQSCHTNRKARQDCVLCHKYHVNGVVTPIMSTKVPD
jgi:hypothetical protein